MTSEATDKVIQEVVDIFINAEVQTVPSYKEIEEEFIILDKVHVTRDMIECVEGRIGLYLDKKWPEYNHIEGLIIHRWTKRQHIDPTQAI